MWWPDQYNQFAKQGYPKPPDFQWTFNGPSSITGTLAIWWIQHNIASEPIGFVGWDGNDGVYVVFRGTMTDADKAADADFGQTPYDLVPNFGNVDKGYYGIYTNLSLPTASSGETTLLAELASFSLINTLYVTGHSLGAGLSTLAVPDIITNATLNKSSGFQMVHYNFGSPRVGDPTFANAMNFQTGVATLRVVNTEDVVPDAPTPTSATGPMLYEHVGYPVDFTANYGSVDNNHSMANGYAYAVANRRTRSIRATSARRRLAA
jgi:triacylglycerol lipase